MFFMLVKSYTPKEEMPSDRYQVKPKSGHCRANLLLAPLAYLRLNRNSWLTCRWNDRYYLPFPVNAI